MLHIKTLTDEEFEYLNDKYIFEFNDGFIITSCKGYNRKVLHDATKPFSLNTPVRKITITKQAIKYWIEMFMPDYTLLEVQHAINSLIVTYQDISPEDIRQVLDRKGVSIKIV